VSASPVVNRVRAKVSFEMLPLVMAQFRNPAKIVGVRS
jgi:hypothetical protein